MAERKAISKKIRFEVFKRDSFKCQYCGRSSPEIVLQIDHIHPVSKGGKNNILNLITSCFDCNSGKSDRKLDDNTIIEKQRKQIEELNNKREQLEMMLEWREGITSIEEEKIQSFIDEYSIKIKKTLYIKDKPKIKSIIRRYGLMKALDAIDIAAERELRDNGLLYIDGICRKTQELEEKPYMSKIYYIRGILRNRLRDYYDYQDGIIQRLEDLYLAGYPIETLTYLAKKAEYIKDFEGGL